MNIGVIILIAIAGILGFRVFFWGSSVELYPNPSRTPPAAMDSSLIKSQEQQTIEDTEAKRQKMMDDMKQKIEDAGKKY